MLCKKLTIILINPADGQESRAGNTLLMFFFLQIRLILVFGTIAGLQVCIFLAIVSKLVWASTMCWYSYGPWIEQAYSGSFCYNYTMYFGMFSCLLFIHFLLSVTSFFLQPY